MLIDARCLILVLSDDYWLVPTRWQLNRTTQAGGQTSGGARSSGQKRQQARQQRQEQNGAQRERRARELEQRDVAAHRVGVGVEARDVDVPHAEQLDRHGRGDALYLQ